MSRVKSNSHAIERKGRQELKSMNPLLAAKLWNNPLGFSHRLNITALHFNVPVYDWIERRRGLTRPQFVVLFSLHLRRNSTAHDICITSGFPKNTISRAVLRTIAEKLVVSRTDPQDNRRLLLRLTAAGQAIVDDALPVLRRKEQEMLSALTKPEQKMLDRLLERIILRNGGREPIRAVSANRRSVVLSGAKDLMASRRARRSQSP